MPGAMPFGFMLLQAYARSLLLDALTIEAGLFGFLFDVPIPVLFFFANTAHMLLLGYCTLLAARSTSSSSHAAIHQPQSKTSARECAIGSPRKDTSPLPPLLLPWHRYSLTFGSSNLAYTHTLQSKWALRHF
jgi:hypothetical protein